jgi:hypothetical protein
MDNSASCGWGWIVAGVILLAAFGQLHWLLLLAPVAAVLAIAAAFFGKPEDDRACRNGVA